jgi:nucleoside recognition membrane protein YjiH
MSDYLNSLQDGWTIYLWLVAGALIIIASIIAIRWAAKNEQFDEDIKYVVFDENDKDKMTPEEFNKAMQVNKAQEELREVFVKKAQQEKAEKRARKG